MDSVLCTLNTMISFIYTLYTYNRTFGAFFINEHVKSSIRAKTFRWCYPYICTCIASFIIRTREALFLALWASIPWRDFEVPLLRICTYANFVLYVLLAVKLESGYYVLFGVGPVPIVVSENYFV